MYISNLSDEQIISFVEADIKKSEGEIAWRSDGAILDLMGDMFSKNHSRNDKQFLYEIKQIKRGNSYIDVKGYSVRVKCPGRYRTKNSDVVKGNFVYRLTDLEVNKIGNISWNGFEKSNYVKFVYTNLSEEISEEFKNFYLANSNKEAYELISK